MTTPDMTAFVGNTGKGLGARICPPVWVESLVHNQKALAIGRRDAHLNPITTIRDMKLTRCVVMP